jgi:hypothetical protein
MHANNCAVNDDSKKDTIVNCFGETPEDLADRGPTEFLTESTVVESQQNDTTPHESVVKSIPKELLRDDSLHDEVFHPDSDSKDDSTTFSTPSADKMRDNGKADGGLQQQKDTVPSGKDVNMNLPPKCLPDILKGTLGKTQALPQESNVTAKYSRILTINVRGPSSASAHSDRDSADDLPRPGLVQDGIFNMEEINSAPSTSNTPEKPFFRENIRNPDYVVRKITKFKSSTTSTDSTSGTSTSKGSVVSAFSGSVLSNMPETVPEVDVNTVEDNHIAKNISVSMEVLQVSEKLTTSDMLSDSQLLSGSTPNLSGRSLSPVLTSQRSDRPSDESLVLPRTASSSTISSSSFSDLTYLIDLAIQTKVKVSNRPVKCLVPTR